MPFHHPPATPQPGSDFTPLVMSAATPASDVRTLIVMRHSEAAYGGNDFARPLTAHGRKIAALQGATIAQLWGQIDLALTSGAARTVQTLEAMKSVGLAVRATHGERSLYSASWEEALALIRTVGAEVRTLLVLFHQPSVAALTAMLTPESERNTLRGGFPPATFAAGNICTPWEALATWQRPHIWQPRG